MTKDHVDRRKNVGWLQYFFENHLPESPCPPGCRHRHSSFRRKVAPHPAGSISSGSPPSSDTGDELLSHTTEELSSSYGGGTTEESSYRDRFSPIPLLIDGARHQAVSLRATSNPYSDCGSSGGFPGYGGDFGAYSFPGDADDGLRELDDLISLYSEKLSETESDMRSGSSRGGKGSPSAYPYRNIPAVAPGPNQHFSFSDTEVEQYHRSRQGCGVPNCHCTSGGSGGVKGVSPPFDHIVFRRSPYHRSKTFRDSGTQCIYSDIVESTDRPMFEPLTRVASDEDSTLTKTRTKLQGKTWSFTSTNFAAGTPAGVLPHEPEDDDDDLFRPTLADLHRDLAQTSSGNTASSCLTTSSGITTTASTFDSHGSLGGRRGNGDIGSARLDKSSTELTKVSSLESNKTRSNSPHHDSRDDSGDLILNDGMTSVSNFTPFMVDFFEFAVRPEDFLTDEQLKWYYEGEAKLMKRREERKRARNALIEETARLEQASGIDAGSDKRSISVSSREKQRTVLNANDVRSALPEVENVDIPQDLLDNATVIRLAQQLKNSQNLHKEEMVKCAKLDNERSTLLYSVEDLKDQLEDQTELAAELKITLKAKCRDIEKLKMQLSQRTKDVELLTHQVHQREELLKEKAGIVITQLGDIMEVPLDSDIGSQNGVLDKYSIKKVEEIEKENNNLKDEIAALREELQLRSRPQVNSTNNHIESAADTDLLNIKRELEKAVETYKAKLTVEERDKIKLLGQISVLESQVSRYRAQAKSASEAEDEALKEKRKIQKELRTVKEDLQTIKDENAILQRRVQRPTINR